MAKISKTKLKAHWVDISDATTDNGGYDWHIRDLQCYNCGNRIRAYHGPNFCENCGAKMQKGGAELYREETCKSKNSCDDYKYWHCIGCNGCKKGSAE
jgi:hypothetical protein